MSNIKISNHVVLDSGTKISSIRVNKTTYRYTEQGMLLYPIGDIVPVIVRGRGCIGIAVIKSLTMTVDTTTVDFEYTEVDNNTAKILYSMYRNSATMTAENNNDPYNTDAVIPGAMLGGPQINLASKNHGSSYMSDIFDTIGGGSSRTRGQRNGSIHDIDDED